MDIKSVRERLNLTREKLAHKLGVSWATVARWERGKGKPSPLAQKALEDLLEEEGVRNEVVRLDPRIKYYENLDFRVALDELVNV